MPLLHVVLHLSVSHKGFAFTESIIPSGADTVNSQKDNFFAILLCFHVYLAKSGKKDGFFINKGQPCNRPNRFSIPYFPAAVNEEYDKITKFSTI